MTEQQRDRWHGIAVTERVAERSNQAVGDGAFDVPKMQKASLV